MSAKKAATGPKKVRIFRLKALIPWLVITGVLVAGYVLFFDIIVKRGIEATATALNGAKVEIDEFDFRLIDTSVQSSGISWTDRRDPMSNLFEIGETEFTLDSRPLSRKKFYIERMALTGIRFDTNRESSGALDEAPAVNRGTAAGSGGEAGEGGSSSGGMSLSGAVKGVDVNDIVSEEDIPVIRMAKDLEQRIKEREAYWSETLPKVTDLSELQKVKREVEAIGKRSYRLPRDLPQVEKDIETLKRAERLVKEKEAELKQARRQLQSDVRMLESDYDNITALQDENLSDLLIDKTDNPFSAENILRAIIGDSIIETAQKYLGMYERVKGYLPEKKQTDDVKVVKKERRSGTTVDFVKAGALPSVFVERIDLSGSSGRTTTLSGSVRDASSDLAYKPVSVDLVFHDTERDFDIATLDGTASRGADGFAAAFTLKANRSPLSQFSDEIENAYVRGIGGTADVTATLDETPERTRTTILIEGRNVSFDLKEENLGRDLQNLLSTVLADIPLLTVDIEYEKRDGKTTSSISSNLEPILNARLKAYVDAEVAKLNRQIRQRFDAEVEKALRPVRAELNRLDESGTLASALDDTENLDKLQARLEADIEKKLKAEENKAKQKVQEQQDKAKEKIEEELKNQLKNLF